LDADVHGDRPNGESLTERSSCGESSQGEETQGDGAPCKRSLVYSGSYNRGHEFIAIVTEYDFKTGVATIEQRNKFVVGDEIEVVRASGPNFRQVVRVLTDTDGNAVHEAPHPQQQLRIQLDKEVSAFDMLRMKRV
jgi:putative protease